MNPQLHDYVKKHYENGDYGNYHDGKYEYHYENSTRDVRDDYELGFQKGKADRFNHYRYFPLKLFKKLNQLFHGRLHEIVDYIEGYRAAFQQ